MKPDWEELSELLSEKPPEKTFLETWMPRLITGCAIVIYGPIVVGLALILILGDPGTSLKIIGLLLLLVAVYIPIMIGMRLTATQLVAKSLPYMLDLANTNIGAIVVVFVFCGISTVIGFALGSDKDLDPGYQYWYAVAGGVLGIVFGVGFVIDHRRRNRIDPYDNE